MLFFQILALHHPLTPWGLKLRGGVEKRALRAALAGPLRLPRELVERPKCAAQYGKVPNSRKLRISTILIIGQWRTFPDWAPLGHMLQKPATCEN